MSKESEVERIPFNAKNQNMNPDQTQRILASNQLMSQTQFINLKGVSITPYFPCCPPIGCCKSRRYDFHPMTDKGTLSDMLMGGIEITECCDKCKYSTILTAPYNLQVSINEIKSLSGIVPAKNRCCASCCYFCSCCCQLNPMTITNAQNNILGTIVREIGCFGGTTRTVLDSTGKAKYKFVKSCCKCGCRCCTCFCCCCDLTKIFPIYCLDGSDEGGTIIYRIKVCPPCKLPTWEVIFPKNATEEMRISLVLGVCEFEYFYGG